jgi:hypothetical protein
MRFRETRSGFLGGLRRATTEANLTTGKLIPDHGSLSAIN